MIVTTTNSIAGKNILEYKGIVFGEVIAGINVFKDFGASFRNVFGGRSQGYEDELTNARNTALTEIQSRAAAVGANAILGLDVDYEMLGADNGMMMVSVSGTAVVID